MSIRYIAFFKLGAITFFCDLNSYYSNFYSVTNANYFVEMVKGQHIDIDLIVHGDRRSYTAGSTVAGTVSLKLSKDALPIHHISVVFSGNADVLFSINLDRFPRPFTNPTNLCTVMQKVWYFTIRRSI